MADRVETGNPPAADLAPIGRDRAPTRAPRPSAADVVPVIPNLLAALASFLVLLLAPFFALHALAIIEEHPVGQAINADPLTADFLLTGWVDSLSHAAVGSLLFLVISAILQVRAYQRPFAVLWPIVMAWPVAIGLLVPESLLRGGSGIAGSLVAAGVAFAFGVHWWMVVRLSDALD